MATTSEMLQYLTQRFGIVDIRHVSLKVGATDETIEGYDICIPGAYDLWGGPLPGSDGVSVFSDRHPEDCTVDHVIQKAYDTLRRVPLDLGEKITERDRPRPIAGVLYV